SNGLAATTPVLTVTPGAGPSLHIAPTSIVAGESITVTGSGFQPFSNVGSPPLALASSDGGVVSLFGSFAQTDSQGNFSAVFQAPAGAPPGMYRLRYGQICCSAGSESLLSDEVLTIASLLSPAPELTLSD